MTRRPNLEDIFKAIHACVFDGETPFFRYVAEALTSREDYSVLLSTELPKVDPLTRAMILLELAKARHGEALPHAVTILNAEDGSVRFLAALSAAYLNDPRGNEEIRRQIADTPPEVSIFHVVEALEKAAADGRNPEFRELLELARAAASVPGPGS